MAANLANFDFHGTRTVPVRFTNTNTVVDANDHRVLHATARLPSGLSRGDKDGIVRTIMEDWSDSREHGWVRTCQARIHKRRLSLRITYSADI